MLGGIAFGAALCVGICSQVVAATLPCGNASPRPLGVGLQDWWEKYLEAAEQGDEGLAEDLLRTGLDTHYERAAGELVRLLAERAEAYRGSGDPLASHLADGLLYEALDLIDGLLAVGDPGEADVVASRSRMRAWVLELLGQRTDAAAQLDELLGTVESAEEFGWALRQRFDFCLRGDDTEAAERLLRDWSGDPRSDASLVAAMDWDLALARESTREPEPLLARAERAFADGMGAFEVCDRVWAAASGETLDLESLTFVYSSLLGTVEAPEANAVVRYFRGVSRLYARDIAGAVHDLETVHEGVGLESRAGYFLGRALLSAGRIEEAGGRFVAVVERGAEYYREALLGLVDVGAALGRAGRHADSLVWFDRVLQHEPDNEWALLGRPLCFEGQDDVAGAETAYREALEILPEHPQLTNDLALVLRGAGRIEESWALFEQAASLGSVDAMENLGVLEFDAEGPGREPAAAHFARVLQEAPDRVKSRFYRELSLLPRPVDPPPPAVSAGASVRPPVEGADPPK